MRKFAIISVLSAGVLMATGCSTSDTAKNLTDTATNKTSDFVSDTQTKATNAATVAAAKGMLTGKGTTESSKDAVKAAYDSTKKSVVGGTKDSMKSATGTAKEHTDSFIDELFD